jgi:beta-glucosidase
VNALMLILAVQAPVLQLDGQRFRDLNRNGTLDRYEDWRLTPEQRARDLVARMTLEESRRDDARHPGTTGPTGGARRAQGHGRQSRADRQ